MNGPFVTRHAALEVPHEPAKLNVNLPLEAKNVLQQLRRKLATLTTVQLTAYKPHGVNGPNVTKHVEEANKAAPGLLLLNLLLVELHVELVNLYKHAMRTHVQLTV